MNPYDQAHALARALKDSEEYREYARLKEAAFDDETNKALLEEYKRLQFRMQARLASGENMPEEDLQRLKQIGLCDEHAGNHHRKRGHHVGDAAGYFEASFR